MKVDYYAEGDVLYVKTDGKVAVDSFTRGDADLILKVDASGSAVGAIVLWAADMTDDEWTNHPDRGELGPELVAAIDEWRDNRTGS